MKFLNVSSLWFPHHKIGIITTLLTLESLCDQMKLCKWRSSFVRISDVNNKMNSCPQEVCDFVEEIIHRSLYCRLVVCTFIFFAPQCKSMNGTKYFWKDMYWIYSNYSKIQSLIWVLVIGIKFTQCCILFINGLLQDGPWTECSWEHIFKTEGSLMISFLFHYSN